MKFFSHIFFIFLFTGSILFPVNGFSQLRQYSFGQLERMDKGQARNVLVFVHTDWCKYCQSMVHTTFRNKEIVQLLNSHFYFISLDPEKEDDIVFSARVYRSKKTGTDTGSHEILSLFYGSRAMAFPAVVILNPDHKVIFKTESFLTAGDLQQILQRYIY